MSDEEENKEKKEEKLTISQIWSQGIYETYKKKYKHVFDSIEKSINQAMKEGDKSIEGFVIISQEPLEQEEYFNFRNCLDKWSYREGIKIKDKYNMLSEFKYPRLDWHYIIKN